jgi:hypothetical protein
MSWTKKNLASLICFAVNDFEKLNKMWTQHSKNFSFAKRFVEINTIWKVDWLGLFDQ